VSDRQTYNKIIILHLQLKVTNKFVSGHPVDSLRKLERVSMGLTPPTKT